MRNANALSTFLSKFSLDFWSFSTLIAKPTTHFGYRNPGFFVTSGAGADAASTNKAFFPIFFVVSFLRRWLLKWLPMPFSLQGHGSSLLPSVECPLPQGSLQTSFLPPSPHPYICPPILPSCWSCHPVLLPFWSSWPIFLFASPLYPGQRTPPVVLSCIGFFWVGPGITRLSSCCLESLACPACLEWM
jgi:hypothetical protein